MHRIISSDRNGVAWWMVVLVLGILAAGCGSSGDDDATFNGDDDASSPTPQSGDDDDSTSDSSAVFFEDFEGDSVALEHEYQDPSYQYYSSIDEMFANGMPWFNWGIVKTYSDSTVFAYSINSACNGDSRQGSGQFVYQGAPIDLSHCTTGTLSFDWGYEDYSTYYQDRDIETNVTYYGMGYDSSVTPTGKWSFSYDSYSDGSASSSFGPEHVTYPLDYDCGYETQGEFYITLYIKLRPLGSGDCSANTMAGLVWIDNISVDLQ